MWEKIKEKYQIPLILFTFLGAGTLTLYIYIKKLEAR